jgi:hypothetical protein
MALWTQYSMLSRFEKSPKVHQPVIMCKEYGPTWSPTLLTYGIRTHSYLESVQIGDTQFEFQTTRMSLKAISQTLSLVQDREIEGDRSLEMLQHSYMEVNELTQKQTK